MTPSTEWKWCTRMNERSWQIKSVVYEFVRVLFFYWVKQSCHGWFVVESQLKKNEQLEHKVASSTSHVTDEDNNKNDSSARDDELLKRWRVRTSPELIIYNSLIYLFVNCWTFSRNRWRLSRKGKLLFVFRFSLRSGDFSI